MRVQQALTRAVVAVFFGEGERRFEDVVEHRGTLAFLKNVKVADVVKHVDKADTATDALHWLNTNIPDAAYLDDIKTAALLIIAGESVNGSA